jgi:hypothetical protein
LEVLLDVAARVDDDRLLGSLAADHVRSVSQDRVVEIFEQHRRNSFNYWLFGSKRPQRKSSQLGGRADFLTELTGCILPESSTRLASPAPRSIFKCIDIFRYVNERLANLFCDFFEKGLCFGGLLAFTE